MSLLLALPRGIGSSRAPLNNQTKPLAATSFEEGALIDNLRENRNIGPVEYLGNAYAQRKN